LVAYPTAPPWRRSAQSLSLSLK